MTDNQTNRFEMAQTTLTVLDAHRPAWTAIPDTIDDRDTLAALLADVSAAALAQADPTQPVTEVKAELRDDVRTRVLHLAAAVHSWASRRGMTELAARNDLTRTEVYALRDFDLAKQSEIVVADARDHLDGEDGLTARQNVPTDEVDALDALDDRFAADLTTPRTAIVARSRATAEIAEHLSAVHRLLRDHLDPAVARLADAHPDFAREYRAARIIVDRGHGRSSDDPMPEDPPA